MDIETDLAEEEHDTESPSKDENNVPCPESINKWIATLKQNNDLATRDSVQLEIYGDGRFGMKSPSLQLMIFIPMFDMLGYQIAYAYLREKRDLEFVLSWLSTLGGACSAMGDCSSDWALEAGKVSMTQFKVAMKLGDPLTLSRCRLYFALSLTQRGRLKEARLILEREYKFIKQLPPDCDPRLLKMCFGCWSRLQYAMKRKREIKQEQAISAINT